MAKSSNKTHMTYEEHLDEVATLLTEIYTLSDQVAIDIVVRAQADDYFFRQNDRIFMLKKFKETRPCGFNRRTGKLYSEAKRNRNGKNA